MRNAEVNHFNRAIVRMEALDAACTELITMATKDIAELKERRKNARVLIEAWKKMAAPAPAMKAPADQEWEARILKLLNSKFCTMYEHQEAEAKEIADREPQSVGCMGVGMKY